LPPFVLPDLPPFVLPDLPPFVLPPEPPLPLVPEDGVSPSSSSSPHPPVAMLRQSKAAPVPLSRDLNKFIVLSPSDGCYHAQRPQTEGSPPSRPSPAS
jgi:hypothetical protein